MRELILFSSRQLEELKRINFQPLNTDYIILNKKKIVREKRKRNLMRLIGIFIRINNFNDLGKRH
jgi:hypothetical protein